MAKKVQNGRTIPYTAHANSLKLRQREVRRVAIPHTRVDKPTEKKAP